MWLMYNVMRPWCQKMEAKLSFSDTTLSPPPPPRFLPVWVCVMAVSRSFSALYILFQLNLKKHGWRRMSTCCFEAVLIPSVTAHQRSNSPRLSIPSWIYLKPSSGVFQLISVPSWIISLKKKKKEKKLLAKTYRFEWKAWNYSVSLYWKDKTCINHP